MLACNKNVTTRLRIVEVYSDGHRLRTCFGKFNINFEPRATLDLEPKTIHLEPLIILNDISLCSIYVLTIIDRLGR